MNVVAILGAGFSTYSKIPTTPELLELIVTDDERDTSFDKCNKYILKKFLNDIFGWRSSDISGLPSFEDMFTMLDLSAKSGHGLGHYYPPQKLRAIRRILIRRLFVLLDRRFDYSNDISEFIVKLQTLGNVNFIVLNWDIILEKHLTRIASRQWTYGIEAYLWDGETVQRSSLELNGRCHIAKVHGSANWLYCDNCRCLFVAEGEKIGQFADNARIIDDINNIFVPYDANIQQIDKYLHQERTLPLCNNCRAPQLRAQIATFSFRKDLDTVALSESWNMARRMLQSSDYWVFCGYSLPVADFEFKHLLKTSQLSRYPDHKLMVDVITSKEHDGEATVARYKKLFGSGASVGTFLNGLPEYLRN